MPLALLIVGLLVVVSGFKNNAGKLGATIATDFQGSGNFFYWIIAVAIIGGLGYNPKLKQISHLFLLLIVIVFIISNNGFFAKLQQAIANPLPASSNGAADASNTPAKPNYIIPPIPGTGFPGVTTDGLPSLSTLEGAASTVDAATQFFGF